MDEPCILHLRETEVVFLELEVIREKYSDDNYKSHHRNLITIIVIDN